MSKSSSIKLKLNLLSLASLAGVGVSIALTQHYYAVRSGLAGLKSYCNLGASFNCDVVAASPYSELIGGLPLSSFGAGWFAALFIASLMARSEDLRKESLRFGSAWTLLGLLLSVVYLAIMAYTLRTYCLLCLIVDALVLLSTGLVAWMNPPSPGKGGRDMTQWKNLAFVALGSLLISVVGLKGAFGSGGMKSEEIREVVSTVLSTPPVAVGSGPEFPSFGPSDAPITIVEFSDFQCPYCRIGASLLHAVSSRYRAQVRVVMRHYPLDQSCNPKMQRPLHAASCEAARATYCARQQGRFEALYDSLFEHQAELKPGKPLELASKEGLNADSLQGCMGSPEAAQAVSRDLEEGNSLGIEGTPTIFINGHRTPGLLPIEAWDELIRQLLAARPKS